MMDTQMEFEDQTAKHPNLWSKSDFLNNSIHAAVCEVFENITLVCLKGTGLAFR